MVFPRAETPASSGRREHHASRVRDTRAAAKQSFEDMHAPKLELGSEVERIENPAYAPPLSLAEREPTHHFPRGGETE